MALPRHRLPAPDAFGRILDAATFGTVAHVFHSYGYSRPFRAGGIVDLEMDQVNQDWCGPPPTLPTRRAAPGVAVVVSLVTIAADWAGVLLAGQAHIHDPVAVASVLGLALTTVAALAGAITLARVRIPGTSVGQPDGTGCYNATSRRSRSSSGARRQVAWAAFRAPTRAMSWETRCRDVDSLMPRRWAAALCEPASR